jgi:hypothetical protein
MTCSVTAEAHEHAPPHATLACRANESEPARLLVAADSRGALPIGRSPGDHWLTTLALSLSGRAGCPSAHSSLGEAPTTHARSAECPAAASARLSRAVKGRGRLDGLPLQRAPR